MLPQQYCLRWKYHHSNLQAMFSQLLDRGCFCDVTLACEGQLIRAHRVVLCACSTFFDTVLTNYASERDPIIIMKDVTFADVKSLIEFMYKGEINVEHVNLASLLKTADDLKIKGLAEVSWRDEDEAAANVAAAAAVVGIPQLHADADFSPPSPPRPQDTYATVKDANGSLCGGGGGGGSCGGGGAFADAERGNASVSSLQSKQQQLSAAVARLPMLTPLPTSSINIAAAAPEHYSGPKRKRGRPPLDDTYDVFNVRKLTPFTENMDAQAFLDGGSRLYGGQTEEPRRHTNSVYQKHIQQQQQQQHQQRRQRQRQEQHHAATDSEDADDNQNDPEWITSNLEVNVGETADVAAMSDAPRNKKDSPPLTNEHRVECREKDTKALKTSPSSASSTASAASSSASSASSVHGARDEKTPDRKVVTFERSSLKADKFKKRSILEKVNKEQKLRESKDKEKDHHHDDQEAPQSSSEPTVADNGGVSDAATLLLAQTVDDFKVGPQKLEQSEGGAPGAAGASHSPATTSEMARSSQSSVVTKASTVTALAHTHPLSHSHPHIPPAHANFAKYVSPEGAYVLSEHGMLMAPDFAAHPAATNNAANGTVADHDFADIKMEDFDAADLRLTSEEMSQWQDVIKMDDYLAKGRRPQFWEEPFTRRVLDAIKNKRLEMKKAARILGVSYGTLYGRYREVYGCLKHPYSSTMRPPQSTQLSSVQPRFDITWPVQQRDASLLANPLEIGKIRPKDLSELWTRPQM